MILVDKLEENYIRIDSSYTRKVLSFSGRKFYVRTDIQQRLTDIFEKNTKYHLQSEHITILDPLRVSRTSRHEKS